MGHSIHHRIDRLQIVSVGSLRDQSATQFIVGGAHHKQADRALVESGAREVVARMQCLNRLFRELACKGPPYLYLRIPEDILVKTSQAIVIF